MGKFAKETTVDTDRTMTEIKRLLLHHGATKFAYFEAENQVAIAFEMQGRRIRFTIPLPDAEAKEFWYTPERGLRRTQQQATHSWQQAVRQRYRALLNVIKFKLIAIEDGVATFEEEFLAWTLLPTGKTVAEEVKARVQDMYTHGTSIPLLPEGQSNLETYQSSQSSEAPFPGD